jgi:tRNA (cytidine32/uridine32-2'-O)-methyltransferase
MSDASLPSLDNVVVVLSRPTEPMNIGAACRAMKTMGLSRLRLIAPLNPKGRSARALAHGAEDILDNALVVDDLLDAVSDALVVTGTTARERQLRKRALLTPAELADNIAEHSREGRVVIMFGTERTGLTNDEIDICRHLSTVDTAPEQPSLNLAQAVMLYGWEIRQAMQRAGAPDALGARGRGLAPRGHGSATRPNHPHRGTRLPTQGELDHMYAHLAHAMAAIGYTPRERLKFPHLPQAPAHARRHRQLGDAHLPHPGAPHHGRAAGAPLPGTAGRARTVGRGAGGDGGGDCRASGR